MQPVLQESPSTRIIGIANTATALVAIWQENTARSDMRSVRLLGIRACVCNQDAHVWPRGCSILSAGLPPGGSWRISLHWRRSGRDHDRLLRSEAELLCLMTATAASTGMQSIQTSSSAFGRHATTAADTVHDRDH
jgi:hypothetical protein